MNRLLATTALALMLGTIPALAETPVTGNGTESPRTTLPPAPPEVPAMQSPDSPPAMPDKSSEAPSPAPKDDLAAKDLGASKDLGAKFLTAQASDDWLASTIIDKPVVNAANQSIGDVNDLVTDSHGRIIAALIGVGGFLGIGEKDVAVPYKDLKLARDANDNVTVVANLTKDQLSAAPDYQTLDEQDAQNAAAKSDEDGKIRTY